MEDQMSSGPEGAYRVNISQEAKDLQAKKGDPSKKDKTKQTEKSSSGEAAGKVFGSDSSQSNIDEQIKEIQEKIKAIKEKIAALANDNSEAAQQLYGEIE
jgi:small-conductance mechanosensitive channel